MDCTHEKGGSEAAFPVAEPSTLQPVQRTGENGAAVRILVSWACIV